MTDHPTTLRALLDRLAAAPVLRMTDWDGRGRRVRFVRLADGGLWFLGEEGAESYVPIDCGKTPAETGLSFHAAGFTVTKFGRTIRFDYEGDEEHRS